MLNKKLIDAKIIHLGIVVWLLTTIYACVFGMYWLSFSMTTHIKFGHLLTILALYIIGGVLYISGNIGDDCESEVEANDVDNSDD